MTELQMNILKHLKKCVNGCETMRYFELQKGWLSVLGSMVKREWISISIIHDTKVVALTKEGMQQWREFHKGNI